MWVLDYLDDLESDFSAVHGIDNMYDLPSQKFLRMAERMAAYNGVMAARAAAEHERRQGSMPSETYEPVSGPPVASDAVLERGDDLARGYGPDGAFPAVIEWGGA